MKVAKKWGQLWGVLSPRLDAQLLKAGTHGRYFASRVASSPSARKGKAASRSPTSAENTSATRDLIFRLQLNATICGTSAARKPGGRSSRTSLWCFGIRSWIRRQHPHVTIEPGDFSASLAGYAFCFPSASGLSEHVGGLRPERWLAG